MPQSLVGTAPPSPLSKRQRDSDAPDGILEVENVGESKPAANRQGFVPISKIPVFLNKSRSDISLLFQELEWKQRFRLSHAFTHDDSPFRVDRSPAVISRNRYGNVQPWDASRVKLKVPIGGSDYVNASPISLKARSGQSSEAHSSENPPSELGTSATVYSELKYIATQGPKDGQFSHFWHMVMQETVGDVGVIVMLTTCYEGNKEKCSQYFPAAMQDPKISLTVNEAGEDEASRIGDPFLDSNPMSADADSFDTELSQTDPDGPVVTDGEKLGQTSDNVTLVSVTEDTTTGCQVRQLQLEIGGDNKTIYHYLFSGWPDYGKPDAEARRALLELVKQSAERAGRRDNPRFVHCSAGVGRTGTFIALDYLLQELDKGMLGEETNQAAVIEKSKTSSWGRSGPMKESTPEAKEDIIYETVEKLREQRMMMVMNEVQFSFLYEVLKEAFIAKYAKRESGPVITQSEPVPKIPRKQKEIAAEETKVGDDEEGSVSEAETDVVEDVVEDGEVTKDPYSVVSPESVKQDSSQGIKE